MTEENKKEGLERKSITLYELVRELEGTGLEEDSGRNIKNKTRNPDEIKNSDFDVEVYNQKRKNQKLNIASNLAVGLWTFLGVIAGIHMISIVGYAGKFISPNPIPSSLALSLVEEVNQINSNEDDEQAIDILERKLSIYKSSLEIRSQEVDRTIASINDTSKTLYTFLTPLAAAVTAYFFHRAEEESGKNKDSGNSNE